MSLAKKMKHLNYKIRVMLMKPDNDNCKNILKYKLNPKRADWSYW